MKIQIQEPCLQEYQRIASLLGEENLFVVGGYVRDVLLGGSPKDLDIATPLPPEVFFPKFEMARYITKYGTLSYSHHGVHVTLASFRKEEGYSDFRHPSKITFIQDIGQDAKRRDFTINALYLDSKGMVLDPNGHGLTDLEHHVIDVIGDPVTRFQEDPLRILRAYRFASSLGFEISERTLEGIAKTKGLLEHLLPQKIHEELKKCRAENREDIIKSLDLRTEKD